ncbi:uncharacterized protein [Dipodomys merriami]|uniref:uncharacterized protein isoform X1 n=1 Tax=Dipodomys merriami TaxID=94247 RepID=UPI003855789A
MGKKHKKHKSDKHLYEEYVEKPLKLVLKVGGNEVTELSTGSSGHDSSLFEDRNDHDKHKDRKRKKRKKGEKQASGEEKGRKRRRVKTLEASDGLGKSSLLYGGAGQERRRTTCELGRPYPYTVKNLEPRTVFRLVGLFLRKFSYMKPMESHSWSAGSCALSSTQQGPGRHKEKIKE